MVVNSGLRPWVGIRGPSVDLSYVLYYVFMFIACIHSSRWPCASYCTPVGDSYWVIRYSPLLIFQVTMARGRMAEGGAMIMGTCCRLWLFISMTLVFHFPLNACSRARSPRMFSEWFCGFPLYWIWGCFKCFNKSLIRVYVLEMYLPWNRFQQTILISDWTLIVLF